MTQKNEQNGSHDFLECLCQKSTMIIKITVHIVHTNNYLHTSKRYFPHILHESLPVQMQQGFHENWESMLNLLSMVFSSRKLSPSYDRMILNVGEYLEPFEFPHRCKETTFVISFLSLTPYFKIRGTSFQSKQNDAG